MTPPPALRLIAMLATPHRASPRAAFLALMDEPVSLPGHCAQVRRDDSAALGALAGLAALGTGG